MKEENKKDYLKELFDDCKKGEIGVMPYFEGNKTIKFVWTNKKGFGRICKLMLNREGMKEAWKYYQEILELNKEKKK